MSLNGGGEAADFVDLGELLIDFQDGVIEGGEIDGECFAFASLSGAESLGDAESEFDEEIRLTVFGIPDGENGVAVPGERFESFRGEAF